MSKTVTEKDTTRREDAWKNVLRKKSGAVELHCRPKTELVADGDIENIT